MALVDELRKLNEVQKVDTQIYIREQAIKALDSGEILKQKAIDLLKKHDAALAKLQQLSAALKDKELQLKTVEGKRDNVHQKLYSGRINNPKELGDLQAEEEMFNTQINDMEGPVLELMDQVEAARISEAKLAEELSAAKRIWKDTVAHTQADTERLKSEISALRPTREQLALKVDKILLGRYDGIRTRHEGVGMVALANDTCQACNVKITSGIMERLHEGYDLTICESCGRILALLSEEEK